MKLYYYEYETSVFSSWEDCKMELQQGYLIWSPFGVAQHFDEDEVNNFVHYEEFIQSISKHFPRNFQIVELK